MLFILRIRDWFFKTHSTTKSIKGFGRNTKFTSEHIYPP